MDKELEANTTLSHYRIVSKIGKGGRAKSVARDERLCRDVAFSPARYHINLRMNVARQLLRETKKSVVAVALDVGYANPSHFAKLFRRETGLSPSDYRGRR